MDPVPLSDLVRDAPVISADDSVAAAMRKVLDSGLPALAVVNAEGRVKGLFGEQEFLGALFPAYFKDLSGAGFVRRSLDEALETRACRDEPVSEHMCRDRLDVPTDFSAAHVAERFLHHPVPVVPVVDEDDRPVGLIRRRDFTRRLAERLLD